MESTQGSGTAVVTGASMGLGAAIAREMAGMVSHMVLVARSEAALGELASELEEAHGLRVTVIVIDLAQPDSAGALHEQLQGETVEILVNNAGFGLIGGFLDLPLVEQQRMMHLNMVTLVALCHLFGNDMARRGGGRIMNLASIAGFQAGPSMAVYCASKAFVLSLSEALDKELRARNVSVTAFCPGPIRTHFHRVAKNDPRFVRPTAASPESVARRGVAAMLRGRRVVVPGWLNRIAVFIPRLLPRRLMNRLSQRVIEG